MARFTNDTQARALSLFRSGTMTQAEVCRQVESETGRRLSERTLREWLRRHDAITPPLEDRLARIEAALLTVASRLGCELPGETRAGWQPPAANVPAPPWVRRQPEAAERDAAEDGGRQPVAAPVTTESRLPPAAIAVSDTEHVAAPSNADEASDTPSRLATGPHAHLGAVRRCSFFDEE